MVIPQKCWPNLISAVMMAELLFAMYHKRKEGNSMRVFFHMVAILIPLLLSDTFLWYLEAYRISTLLLKIDFIVIYSFAMLFIGFYARYLHVFVKEHYGIDSKTPSKVTISILLVFEGLWILSLFTGHFYVFDDNGWFHYTKWHIFSQIGAALVLTPEYWTIYTHTKTLGRRNVSIWSVYLLAVLVVRSFDLKYNLPFLYPSFALVSLLIYLSINVEMENTMKEQQMKLQDHQQKLMISQIQPHFLYNVLNTIVFLCRKDPQLAAETTVDFATYLRMNLNAMAKDKPVLFEEELAHTQTYLNLEMRRFSDILHVEWELKENMSFLLPVLTLQPIVENAVKHGICQTEDGGTLWIRTEEDQENYYVTVEDNGVGFDPSATHKDDGRTHIGMSNTIQRVRDISHGDVIVTSEIGKGTKVKIILPKKFQQK